MCLLLRLSIALSIIHYSIFIQREILPPPLLYAISLIEFNALILIARGKRNESLIEIHGIVFNRRIAKSAERKRFYSEFIRHSISKLALVGSTLRRYGTSMNCV